jgi:hypothetical protein
MPQILSDGQIVLIAIGITILILVVNTIGIRFRSGLRELPGPTLAAYSRLWNILTASSGQAHSKFQELHQRYGKIVRVGPKNIAIVDPKLIPVLYGTNNKFLKVWM